MQASVHFAVPIATMGNDYWKLPLHKLILQQLIAMMISWNSLSSICLSSTTSIVHSSNLLARTSNHHLLVFGFWIIVPLIAPSDINSFSLNSLPGLFHMVTLANGSQTESTRVGTTQPLLPLSIDFVLYVPRFPINLLFISRLNCSLDCFISFTRDFFFFLRDQCSG